MFKPHGIYSAMLTPFTKDLEINEDVARSMVEFMITKGLHGIFPVSSAGEFVHMSPDQCMQLMEIVVDQADGRVPVVPGVISSCPANSIKLAKRAKELGCKAAVVCPPYLYPISQSNIVKHIEVISDAVDIPIVVYNIPIFTTQISVQTIHAICRNEKVVGMKDSSGNMMDLMHMMDIIQRAGDRIHVLSGREDILAPALAVGVKGCMNSTACIFPEILVGIWDAFHAGDWEKAKRLQFEFLPILRDIFAAPFPVGLKIGLEERGFAMGPYVQPLSSEEEQALVPVKARIQQQIKRLLKLIETEGLTK